MIDANTIESQFSRNVLKTILLIVLAAITFAFYVYWERQIIRTNELRIRSIQLANQLHQSSDDLTRMARSYVDTRNPIFKQDYQQILDIREGKIPRPLAYNNYYWDLQLSDRPAQSQPGRAVALLELMQHVGFTEEELDKLELAKANSDALTKLEFSAMALVEKQSVTDENRATAVRLLNDANYHQAKANIMRPISEFNTLMEQRTYTAVKFAEKITTFSRLIFIFISVVLLLLMWRVYCALQVTLGCSVGELHSRMKRLGKGDFATPIILPEGKENTVLGMLAQAQNNLAIMDQKRLEAEEKVRQLAFYDSLTELPNRRLFEDRLRQARYSSKRNNEFDALMFIDLDNFKPLNDQHGHGIGDLLLIEVARRLQNCVREVDTVARFGGDEFVVMLVDLKDDINVANAHAKTIAEHICSTLAQPYQLTWRENNQEQSITHSCSASIGVVIFSSDGGNDEELLKMADDAMYEAKNSGRNRVCFYQSQAN